MLGDGLEVGDGPGVGDGLEVGEGVWVGDGDGLWVGDGDGLAIGGGLGAGDGDGDGDGLGPGNAVHLAAAPLHIGRGSWLFLPASWKSTACEMRDARPGLLAINRTITAAAPT
jgi:hypothetical protein